MNRILLLGLVLLVCTQLRASDSCALLIGLFGHGVEIETPEDQPKSAPTIPTKTTETRPPNPPRTSSRGTFAGMKAGEGRELVPGINFRWCPAGTFTMGSPKSELGYEDKRNDNEDQVQVKFTSGFWLCETEVTQGQWDNLMGTVPWKRQPYVKEASEYAASYISHDDATDYCEKLTKAERSAGRLRAGWTYSLPTEAQWEYACRAGTTTKYSFGSGESQLNAYGWHDGNTKNEQYAHQVGLKQSNDWGLQDMHGNVWEWCSDWYSSKLPGGTDPTGPSSGSSRVFRGGGWSRNAIFCRAADRSFDSPGFRYCHLGFRVACVPSSK